MSSYYDDDESIDSIIKRRIESKVTALIDQALENNIALVLRGVDIPAMMQAEIDKQLVNFTDQELDKLIRQKANDAVKTYLQIVRDLVDEKSDGIVSNRLNEIIAKIHGGEI